MVAEIKIVERQINNKPSVLLCRVRSIPPALNNKVLFGDMTEPRQVVDIIWDYRTFRGDGDAPLVTVVVARNGDGW